MSLFLDRSQTADSVDFHPAATGRRFGQEHRREDERRRPQTIFRLSRTACQTEEIPSLVHLVGARRAPLRGDTPPASLWRARGATARRVENRHHRRASSTWTTLRGRILHRTPPWTPGSPRGTRSAADRWPIDARRLFDRSPASVHSPPGVTQAQQFLSGRALGQPKFKRNSSRHQLPVCPWSARRLPTADR